MIQQLEQQLAAAAAEKRSAAQENEQLGVNSQQLTETRDQALAEARTP